MRVRRTSELGAGGDELKDVIIEHNKGEGAGESDDIEILFKNGQALVAEKATRDSVKKEMSTFLQSVPQTEVGIVEEFNLGNKTYVMMETFQNREDLCFHYVDDYVDWRMNQRSSEESKGPRITDKVKIKTIKKRVKDSIKEIVDSYRTGSKRKRPDADAVAVEGEPARQRQKTSN